jgi:peptide/nickel transport system substrate-binding protein
MDRDREALRSLDEYRFNAGPLENNLLDEFLDGEVDRASFLRHASVIGLSATAIGAALRTMGMGAPAYGATVAGQAGGRLRLAVIPGPSGDLEPTEFMDHGRLATGSICGEFLTRSRQDLTLAPELAVSWKSNADATQWAFNIRRGVKFANGQPLTAADVVATFKTLTDPAGKSQALSAFKGIVGPGGIRAVGDYTVVFYLQVPTAGFPYLTSNTTYQAIILPANYQMGTFTKTPQTTGAFIMTSYTPGVGAKFDRNPNWWGGKSLLDGVDVTYYSANAAVDAALLGNQIDLVSQSNFSSDRSLFGNKNVQIFATKGSPHREIAMLTQTVAAAKPLLDYRNRSAVALAFDRDKAVKQLLGGFGDAGNDSPFAPAFPSTDKTVPQRHQNLAAAKKLLAQAGNPRGFSVTLTCAQFQEIPALAQLLANDCKKVGIDINLNIIAYDAYYGGTYSGGATGRGTTPWLNSPMDITDWGHRSVPNVFLTSAVHSGGVWNEADYANKKVDAAIASYLAALTLKQQRKYARAIELQMLHDSPYIFPYFFNWTQAGSKRVKGFKADAIGTQYLGRTSLA